MPRSAIMMTKSLKLNLKLVYQLTHRMMICPSKCRPLNNASTRANRCILSSSPDAPCLHQNRLSRAEYFYRHPIHFALRSGHLEAVQLLLGAGVDPEWNSFHHGSLIEMARDRGHE